MKRIQRKRTKGWKMPEGAIYVGRPTIWGNPFRVSPNMPALEAKRRYAVYIYAKVKGNREWRTEFEKLRGHDLACWCPLDQPCHADVLIELLDALEVQP